LHPQAYIALPFAIALHTPQHRNTKFASQALSTAIAKLSNRKTLSFTKKIHFFSQAQIFPSAPTADGPELAKTTSKNIMQFSHIEILQIYT